MVIWMATELSPENKRLLTGPARTVNPTVEGMAMTQENRMAMAVRARIIRRSPTAAAWEMDGIREEDKAFDMAMGTLINRWYFPV